jgi:osmotically-inducible protein OsmY
MDSVNHLEDLERQLTRAEGNALGFRVAGDQERYLGAYPLAEPISGSPGPSVSDEALTVACEFALRAFGGVRVHVNHGWVRLSGTVAHAGDRWRAEERVGRVPGASGISAQITVLAPVARWS